MQEAARLPLAAWESFYVIVGSSGAALTGLQFVVIALIAESRRRSTFRLVDVGFGDSFLEPLLLDERDEQRQGSRAYRIIPDGNCLVLTRRDEGEESKLQYRFTLQPHTYADYAEMCRYHQTSPQSHFTRSRICSRATEQGRITMADMRLITTSNSAGSQVRHERTLTSEDEYAAVLREQFGIVV